MFEVLGPGAAAGTSFLHQPEVNEQKVHLGVLLQLPAKVKQRLFHLDKLCKKSLKQ